MIVRVKKCTAISFLFRSSFQGFKGQLHFFMETFMESFIIYRFINYLKSINEIVSQRRNTL